MKSDSVEYRMRYDLDFADPLAYWQEQLVGAATTLGLSVAATVLGFGLASSSC